MSARLLALDPSMTATGWCIAQSAPRDVTTWEHGTVRPKMLSDLAMWFGTMLAEVKPDLVVFEEPLQVIMMYGKKQLVKGGKGFVTPNASQTVLWKLEGMLIGVCALAACPAIAVAPRTWRAAILHDGNLPGPVAKVRAQQACAHMGLSIRSVDEAEACCIALYGLGTIEFREAARKDVHGHALGTGGTEH